MKILPNIFGNNCPWHELFCHILSKTNQKTYSVPWPLLRRSWAAAGIDNRKLSFANCLFQTLAKAFRMCSHSVCPINQCQDNLDYTMESSKIKSLWKFLVNACECLSNKSLEDGWLHLIPFYTPTVHWASGCMTDGHCNRKHSAAGSLLRH